MYFEKILPNNWDGIRRNFQRIESNLFGPVAAPAYGNLTLTGLTANSLIYPDGNKLLTSLGVAADGKIPIGSTGTTPVLAEITGTANQIISTAGAGSITLSTPQDIHKAATDFEVAGLKVVNKITEFSTDGTMGGNSDSALPTEKATKLYTDTLRADLASTANAKGASLVGIEDSMSLYTAVNVEAALEEVMDQITVVTTTANSITTVTGTLDSGNVASTQTINDADTYDVSEVSGTPGFDIQAIMTGIVSGHEPNLIEGHYSYDGNHTVRIEMWNYTGTPAWDLISDTTIENTGGALAFFSLAITGTTTDYVSGGESKVRFNHAVAGNINHDFSIDYLAIKDDHGIGTGITDHGALSGLDEDDHQQYIKDSEFTQDSGILVGTGSGTFAEETGATARASLGLTIGTHVQAYDAGLTSLAGLTYASDSFIKVTAENTYAIRTIAETKTDLALNNVSNVATDDTAYNATSWNANSDAATKNAIRDKVETMDTAIGSNTTHRGLTSGNPHSVTPTELSLVIGTNVQAHDAGLDSLAALGYVSDSMIKITAGDTYAIRTLAEVKTDLSLNNVENTVHSTDAHTMSIDGRDVSVDGTKLDGIEALADVTATNETSHADVLQDGDFGSNGLMERTGAGSYAIKVIGTDVLAYDAGLQNLAGVAMAADKFYYTSGDNTHVAATVTSFARSILDDADEATFKATVNLEIGTDVLAEQTIGIANDNLVEIDDADAADDDFARFTAVGLEGRSPTEVLSDLSGQAGAAFAWNSQNLTGVGTIGCGVVTGTGAATFEGASVTVGKASATTGTLVLHDSNSANTITLTVPDISAGSLSFTLPPTDGANTNVLQTDGNGVLTWAAAGAGGGSTRYDRVNVANADWTQAVINVKASWTALDCSGIVPAGATAIVFNVNHNLGTSGAYFQLKENGTSGVYDPLVLRCQNAGNTIDAQWTVACDANRVVSYFLSNHTTNGLNLTVIGWYI